MNVSVSFVKSTSKALLCSQSLHHFRTVATSGANVYKSCDWCGMRSVEMPSGGYQPIEWGWVQKDITDADLIQRLEVNRSE